MMVEINDKIINACKNCKHYDNSSRTCIPKNEGMHPDGSCRFLEIKSNEGKMTRECDLRYKAIQSALSSKNYAVDPYGFNAKFIWDWQQDNYIELESGENVQEIKNLPHCCVCHIEDFITSNNDNTLQNGYIIEIESVHIYKNHVLSICCKDGVVLSHRAWRDVDWQACGF
jgi:hypothetical protein